jgi:hypothetical protein
MDWLYSAPLWEVAAGFLTVLFVSGEVGNRLGRRASATADERVITQVGAVEASVLGLLGLLLAFTFSMAQTRYEQRRLLVVDEANAIGTVWLRTDALAPDGRDEARALVRRYVDAQLAYYDAGDDDERIAAAERDLAELQGPLWDLAAEAARADPHAVSVTILLEALNEVFDLHDARIAARVAHVPDSVVVLLMIVSAVGLGTVGYAFGLVGRRHIAACGILGLLVAAILVTILDLDLSRRGLIRVSQDSLLRLRDDLAEASSPGS